MDELQYWVIAERDLDIQNPISKAKLALLDDYCGLRAGLRVLDIGCGKAWLLRSWARKHSISGVGVEINPLFLDVARQDTAGFKGRLEFIEGAAAGYLPPPASFDIGLCLGASFAIGDFAQTVDRLAAATRIGGTVAVGELIEREAAPHARFTHHPPHVMEAIAIMERHSFAVTALISASDGDFERYASHHHHAVHAWSVANPGHPERAEMLAASKADWQFYLNTIRRYLGWTIFVARRVAD